MSSGDLSGQYVQQTNTGKAVSTMTTEKHLWTSTQETTGLVRRSSGPVCGCGQDLDIATGCHCPRCGATLLQAA